MTRLGDYQRGKIDQDSSGVFNQQILDSSFRDVDSLAWVGSSGLKTLLV